MFRASNVGRSFAILALPLFAACASSTEPTFVRTERHPALLVLYTDSSTTTVPDTAHRWQPITISVTSFGGGCITQGETDVSVADRRAVLRPYRYEAIGADIVCTDELRIFQHVATVQFANAGQAEVRIVGEGRPGDRPIEIVRPVVVVP